MFNNKKSREAQMKAEWGTRRSCLKCQSAFYDMQKSQIVCPRCGKEYTKKDFIAKPVLFLNNDIPETEEDVRRKQHVKVREHHINDDTLGSVSPKNLDDLLNTDTANSPEALVKDGFI